MFMTRGQTDTFGKRLHLLRRDLDWRQGDLIAEMERRTGVKVGQSYLSEIERAPDDAPIIPGGVIVSNQQQNNDMPPIEAVFCCP